MSPDEPIRWLIADRDSSVHAIVAEPHSGRGWRALCQMSDLGNVLLRDGIDGTDTFCEACARVLASRLRQGENVRQQVTP